MVMKDFHDVFQKVSLSKEVLRAFSDAKVYDLKINRKNKAMLVKLKSKNIIEEKFISDFQTEMAEKIPGVTDVNTVINYEINEDSSVKEKVHKAINQKLEGKTIVKEIYVKNKIYNIVIK